MAEIIIEPEVVQIFEHIDKEENFLLSGGAGSGKTYSLVQVIKKVIKDYPTSRVACMTYTNAAVREIEERVNHDNLTVSTIHDFLWNSIKPFQNELKKILITLINDEDSTIKNPEENAVVDTYFDVLEDGIQYKEYLRVREGIISHDEVLELANHMFKEYPQLCDILKDKFEYIFIDEYQDTNPLVVEIFLDHLKQSQKKNIIGFFGDAMQSIYDDGIGDLNQYIEKDDVGEVQKTQNRRNPELVIGLANKLRTDEIQQEPSIDETAPNMENSEVKQGSIKFLFSDIEDLGVIRNSEYFEGWDFDNSKITKELNLTHNLIAPKAGFAQLMAIYDKDPIIALKNDIVGRIKRRGLTIDEDKSFDEIVDDLAPTDRSGNLKKDEITNNPEKIELYNLLKDLPFSEVKKIYLSKDSLIDDKKQDEDEESKKGSNRDNLIKHLFKIQSVIHLYKEKRYNEFIRKTEFKITSIKRKREIKVITEEIEGMSDNSIEEVIDFANESGICIKDDRFNIFVEKHEYLYNRVKSIPFSEFQNLYNYLEGFTPFSTQHKIKGTEFKNVFVVLDNGGWNNYSFEYLFNESIYTTLSRSKQNSFARKLSRTQKIFYVCCTRAIDNLAVFYNDPSQEVINKAIEWFGEDNVHEIV